MLALLILALIQGIAEFLPISSSGHLVLGRSLLSIPESDATIEIFLHTGTLLAIIIFYRRRILEILRPLLHGELRNENAKILRLIIWASIPAGIVGIIWKDALEQLFSFPRLVSPMLMLTALMLISTIFARRKQEFRWNMMNSLAVGFAQMIAILPGISRSGATIVMALWFGAAPDEAAQFSFLLAIPALAGAMLLKAKDLVSAATCPGISLWIAAIVACIIGYVSLFALIPILKRGKLWGFGIYCAIVGIIGFWIAR